MEHGLLQKCPLGKQRQVAAPNEAKRIREEWIVTLACWRHSLGEANCDDDVEVTGHGILQ